MLINNCACGSSNFTEDEQHNIPVNVCNDCGIIHQRLDITNEEYFSFYESEYHTSFQEHRGTSTYKDRYNHDLNVARLRLAEYEKEIFHNGQVLDIGSSNNAFVDHMNANDYKAEGVEIGEEGAYHDTTHHADLLTLDLPEHKYQLITMHDVLEHLIDMNPYLEKIHKLLCKATGVFIVDFPHFFVEEGYHHWKHTEHLWMLNEVQLTALLEKHGFEVFKTTHPIDSKFVVYCRIA